LLALFLSAPFWLVNLPGYSPKAKWLETPFAAGNYHFIARQIYDEKGDIDILVLGDSLIWCALDTDIMKEQLGKQLRREATVLSFASNWRQEELPYLLLKETLEHRRVKMVILDLPIDIKTNDPHPAAPYWMMLGEIRGDLGGIGFNDWLKIYAVNLIGVPRHILSYLRPNGELSVEKSTWNNSRTGALRQYYSMGLGPLHPPSRIPSLKFKPEQLIYGKHTAGNYEFTGKKLGSYQAYFLAKFFALAAEHDVHVVVTNVPIRPRAADKTTREITDYAKVYPGRIAIASIAPAQLFSGMNDAEIDDYFYNEHMNKNGAELFTRAFMPAITALYKQTEPRR